MKSRRPVVYFHGVPGGPGELEAVASADRWLNAEDYVPDRQMMNHGTGLIEHFDLLAAAVKARFGTTPVNFVGFSLGAYVALEVASRLGPNIHHISLISAAAPLSAGDFLPEMAGKLVFRLARHAPALFATMTSFQSFLQRFAPDKLYDALFASAQGLDCHLARQPVFRARVIDTLDGCLSGSASNYRRELSGYVRDWSAILPLISQPIELWHGTLDNWAPPLMAEALARTLLNVTALHRLEGHSHYSTLQAFIEHQAN